MNLERHLTKSAEMAAVVVVVAAAGLEKRRSSAGPHHCHLWLAVSSSQSPSPVVATAS